VAKRWTWVAWSMLAIFAAAVGVGTALMVVNGEFQQDPAGHGSLLLAFTAFMVVGAVVVAQRPGNRVGWVFSAIGLLAGTGVLAWQYAEYAYTTRGGSLPGAILCAWYTSWWWYPVINLASVFTLLVFPTGQLLSARWRPVALLLAATTLAVIVMSALQPTLGPVGGAEIRNPIGLAAIPDPDATTLGGVLVGLFVVCTGAAALSLVLRYRRSQGVERQQLKWFTYGGALLFLGLVVEDLLPDFPGSGLLFGVAVALLPVAAGIAILRYRLYDIDRLINRTLVYGLLTALLAAVYAGAVLVLGQVFGGVGRDPPSWAVAGATLAVAALFQPARRRIQAVVDRRFNRRKYDTARTVEAFSARLRDQVDLDTLSAELLAVVDQTMQPSQAWLWLRPSTER
jgi:MFS family permease